MPSHTASPTHPTTPATHPPRAAWLSARGESACLAPIHVRLTRFAHFTSPPSLTRNTVPIHPLRSPAPRSHLPRPLSLQPPRSHSTPSPPTRNTVPTRFAHPHLVPTFLAPSLNTVPAHLAASRSTLTRFAPLPPQPTTKCTASAGNFGQGLAWCCQELGVKCTVVAPDQAPQTKLDAMRGYGAEVLTVPYEKWWEIIESHRCPQAPGAVFIHPGAENAVLAGNATVAAEILEELPDVDTVVAPYGSGALCVGIACGVKALGSTCRVVAVEPATAAPFALSRRAGRACRFDAWEPSFVDGCGGKAVLDEIWALAHEHCAHLDG